jgi:hypothetical protein
VSGLGDLYWVYQTANNSGRFCLLLPERHEAALNESAKYYVIEVAM